MLDTRYPEAPSSRAEVRIVLLLAVLAVGLLSGMLAARLTHTWGPSAEPPSAATPSDGLSEATRQTVRAIRDRVDVHFYSILDLPEVPAQLKAFAARVDGVLKVYENESNGRLRVSRHNSLSDAPEAAKVGLRPVVAADQHAAYLGVVLVRQNYREVLPQLLPEWESALEADLTRALQRLSTMSGQPAPARDLPPDSELLAEANRLVPNLGTLPLEQGKQLLKSAAVNELRLAVQEGQARIQEAQNRLLEAEAVGSETEQREALESLRNLQSAHSQRLQDLAERSEARLSAFERANQR